MRGARGTVRFTAADVEAVIELCHRDASPSGPSTFLTPRSQRALARRLAGS